VLGHSFGALCALEAALLTGNIRRLMLYEPSFPLPDQPPIYPAGSLDRLQALIDSGDNEAALIHFYLEVVEMQPAMLEQLRESPAWTERVMSAPTLLREARAEESYVFDPQRFEHLTTPTLFLLGSESPESFKASSLVLNAVLPNSQTLVLEGQQHLAMYANPLRFAQVVREFAGSTANQA
jgi:pimeloyl-ACP methyl ester carboxylesterase